MTPLPSLLALLVSLMFGLWLGTRKRAGSPGTRLVLGILPILLTSWGVWLVDEILLGPVQNAWNETRVATAVGLARGFPLYASADQGSVQTTMYTPLSAVVYTPAALGTNPASVIRIGVALTTLFYFLPVAYLFVRFARSRHVTAAGLTAFACFALLTFNDYGLNYNAFSVHADAPSLGFLLAACATLLLNTPGSPLSLPRCLLSAALAWCAFWSKQTMILPLAAIPVWVALAHDRRTAGRFLLAQALTGLLIALPLLSFFGAQAMFLNAWIIPGSFPWKQGLDPFPAYFSWSYSSRLVNLLLSCFDLGYRSLFLLLVTLGGGTLVLLSATGGDTTRLGHLKRLARLPWSLPLAVGLSLFPISAMSCLKVGGSLNSFGLTLYFFLVSSLLMILEFVSTTRQQVPPQHRRDALPLIGLGGAFTLVQPALWKLGNASPLGPMLCFLAAGLSIALLDYLRTWLHWPARRRQAAGLLLAMPLLAVSWTWSQQVLRRSLGMHETSARIKASPAQVSYEFLKRHPGEAYFPCNPLAHLLAEGRLPHFMAPVIERETVGLPLSKQHLNSFLPRFEFVAYPPGSRVNGMAVEPMQATLGSPGTLAPHRALPGFECYRTPASLARDDTPRPIR